MPPCWIAHSGAEPATTLLPTGCAAMGTGPTSASLPPPVRGSDDSRACAEPLPLPGDRLFELARGRSTSAPSHDGSASQVPPPPPAFFLRPVPPPPPPATNATAPTTAPIAHHQRLRDVIRLRSACRLA